jgi:oligosaccharyltransferase complex subunit alpha (ribophorin I)
MRTSDIPYSGVALYTVELPSSLKAGSTINLVVDTAQTHAIYPWPKEAAQGDEQALKYDTDVFVLSPYKTAVQRTKIRCGLISSPEISR